MQETLSPIGMISNASVLISPERLIQQSVQFGYPSGVSLVDLVPDDMKAMVQLPISLILMKSQQKHILSKDSSSLEQVSACQSNVALPFGNYLRLPWDSFLNR